MCHYECGENVLTKKIETKAEKRTEEVENDCSLHLLFRSLPTKRTHWSNGLFSSSGVNMRFAAGP